MRMRMNSETWYLRGTLLFFNGGLRRRTLENKEGHQRCFQNSKGSRFFKVEQSQEDRPPWFLADKMMVRLTTVLLTHIRHGYRHLRVNMFILLFFVKLTITCSSCALCLVDPTHVDQDVMLTFIMLTFHMFTMMSC